MRRVIAISLAFLLLSGCTVDESELDAAMKLRQELQSSQGCIFTVSLTADFGEDLFQFKMECAVDEQGNLTFSVTEPTTIRGICGTIDDAGGNLTFDDVVLAFPMLADGQFTPVSAPWIMMRSLRGGYITAAGVDGEDIHIMVNDSYEQQALKLDIWLNENRVPKRCEILWEGRRILTMDVENFTIL